MVGGLVVCGWRLGFGVVDYNGLLLFGFVLRLDCGCVAFLCLRGLVDCRCGVASRFLCFVCGWWSVLRLYFVDCIVLWFVFCYLVGG